MTKKKLTVKQKKEKARLQAKKMTVGKASDLGAFLMAPAYRGMQYYNTKDQNYLKQGLVLDFIPFDVTTGVVNTSQLIHGWGPPIVHAVEKKINRVLHVQPPRMKMETIGDVLDWVTYMGPTALGVYNNRASPQNAINSVSRNQYGIDQTQTGWAALDLESLANNKLGPYYLQKIARRGLAKMGMKLPNFKLGG